MMMQTVKSPQEAALETQRGTILLAEGRSGSSWLGQLTTTTGIMGISSEWLDPKLLGTNPKKVSAQDYLAAVIAAASTENGRFALKIFPRHLFWFADKYNVDFLKLCMEKYDVSIARLRRADRLAQAISLVKARQSGAWSSESTSGDSSTFDRAKIVQAIHFLERSDAFWNAHKVITGLSPELFTYEELLADPRPYLDWAAAALDVQYDAFPQAKYAIQRNAQTDEWIARFHSDPDPSGCRLYGPKRGIINKVKSLVNGVRGRVNSNIDFY